MPLRITVLSLALLSAVGRQAAAEELPVNWSYRNPLAEIAFADGATGGLTFPNTVFQPRTGSAEIMATRVASYSIAPDTTPDRITSLPFHFALELRDDLSGETARLTFAGVFSGDLWRTGSELTARYAGTTDQAVLLGGNRYRVELGGFAAPSGYGDPEAGSISALVTVFGSDPPSPVNAPEPATAALAALGLVTVAGAARVRRFPATHTEEGSPA